jgi:hypothetical protein
MNPHGRPLKHGHWRGSKPTPEWNAYNNARERCKRTAPKETRKYYFSRGIKFLFSSFEQFLNCLGLKPSSLHMLDRLNNDGNYEPTNVRWATRREQMLNRRMTPTRREAICKNLILARMHSKRGALGRFI